MNACHVINLFAVISDTCTAAQSTGTSIDCILVLSRAYDELASGTLPHEIAQALEAEFSTKLPALSGFSAKLRTTLGDGQRSAATCAAHNSQVGEFSKLAGRSLSTEDATRDAPILVFNARVLVLAGDNALKPLHGLDVQLLADLEEARIGRHVRQLVLPTYAAAEAKRGQKGVNYADQFLRISSYCGSLESLSGQRFDIIDALKSAGMDVEDPDFDSSFIFNVDAAESSLDDESAAPAVRAVLVVDPLTKAGQRASSLVGLFCEQLRIKQTVILVPSIEQREFPLQNFYRFVVSPHDPSKATAVFASVPKQHTLTLRVDIPEPWNVQTMTASQDIDNLRCIAGKACGDPNDTSGKELTRVSYLLKNLIVSGQCHEGSNGRRNRGMHATSF